MSYHSWPKRTAPSELRHLNCGFLKDPIKSELQKEYKLRFFDYPVKGWYVGEQFHSECLAKCPPLPPLADSSWEVVKVPKEMRDEVRAYFGRDKVQWALMVPPEIKDAVDEYMHVLEGEEVSDAD